MNPPTQAVTAPQKPQLTLRQELESDRFKAQVAMVLPKHLTPERFVRVGITTLMRTPKLADCDPVSFFQAMLTLSQLGIEADGRRAHLIPFFNTNRNCYEVQLIVDYKGLAELAMRSNLVSYLHADVVREEDEFLYDRGQILKHTINFKAPRGKAYAVYSICRFKDGGEKAEVMSIEDVEAIRSRSKAAKSGPWVTDFNEMAKKTVFRRLSKWLPLSPEFRDAVEADEDVIDVESERVPQPLMFTPPTPPQQIEAPDQSLATPIAKRKPGRPRTTGSPEAPKDSAPITREAEPEESSVQPAEEPPVSDPPEQPGLATPQEKLALQIIEAGFGWDDIVEWNKEMQYIAIDLSTLGGFDDLPTSDTMRLLGSITGLIRGLKTRKPK